MTCPPTCGYALFYLSIRLFQQFQLFRHQLKLLFNNSYTGLLLVACCLLLVAGCWLPDAGCWLLVAYCWLPDAGCRLLVAYCWLPDAGCRMLVTGCLLPVACCRLPVAGCRHIFPSRGGFFSDLSLWAGLVAVLMFYCVIKRRHPIAVPLKRIIRQYSFFAGIWFVKCLPVHISTINI